MKEILLLNLHSAFQLTAKVTFLSNRLIEADEKVDVDLELNKIYKSIVKGVDATDRASTAMSTSTSTSKASSPYVVGSNDRYEQSLFETMAVVNSSLNKEINNLHPPVCIKLQGCHYSGLRLGISCS